MKVLGIYHNADLDGKCSGAIILKKYGMENNPDVDQLILHGMNYGYDTPWDLIEEADLVIISDYSLPLADMVRAVATTRVEWYDHHISAINEMKDVRIFGIRDTSRAGCELTWEGLFPDEPVPRVVEMLGSYDCWRWTSCAQEVQNSIMNLQYGMRLGAWWPDDEMWKYLFAGDPEIERGLMKQGKACIQYQAQMMERMVGSGRVVSWEGFSWFAINCQQTASTNYEKKIAELNETVRVQGVIIFHQGQDGSWKYSLRSFNDDLDVSKICKKHGGGGHAGAGGFATEKLLYVLG